MRGPCQVRSTPECSILHSGIVYPSELNPTHLVATLRLFKQQGIDEPRIRIRFRAAVHEQLLRAPARDSDMEQMLDIVPHVSYRATLA